MFEVQYNRSWNLALEWCVKLATSNSLTETYVVEFNFIDCSLVRVKVKVCCFRSVELVDSKKLSNRTQLMESKYVLARTLDNARDSLIYTKEWGWLEAHTCGMCG